jgi:Uma2 family endonuclease
MHQRGLSKLHIRVGSFVYQNGLGEIVEAPVGVVLDEENGLQPDLVYVSRERLGIIAERGIEGAPDLVVEALSRSTRARDRGAKMRRYATAGVPHYWLLDPRARTLEAYRLGQKGLRRPGAVRTGERLSPRAVSGPRDRD